MQILVIYDWSVPKLQINEKEYHIGPTEIVY